MNEIVPGIIICGLLLFGAKSVIPIWAQSDNLSEASANLSQSLVDLLPDIERIYQEALTTPLHEAKKKIYDPDVAQFYDQLLERTALDTLGSGTN